ncbi:MAG: DUF6383 domain-containing protein [Parabacteroides sp.]|nr:DUF6383 domain-containing protein [bacterium]MDY4101516.1 DUF6383 domain-containing protein [Parabacteroides sp.]
MNKKFSTLVASMLLAGGMGAFAQQNALDQAGWPTGSAFVAPYAVLPSNGAIPVAKWLNVNNGAEANYVQLVVGKVDGTAGDGTKALTMVWRKESTPGANDGHYELALEDLTKVGDQTTADARVYLERTLWQVVAKKYANSPVVYYQLINKASQLPLQVAFDNEGDAADGIDVITGSIDWMWSDGATASVSSSLIASTPIHQGVLRASDAEAQNTVYLVADNTTPSYVKTVTQNATAAAPTNAIVFEAWEANPIVLTAEQINYELGYEGIRTQGKGAGNSFKFVFDPQVEGLNATNVMTDNTFVAEDAKASGREAGDAMKGYVRFKKAGNSQAYLMVDTAYHDATVNGKYDLQMAVKEIYAPKFAVVADNELGRYSGNWGGSFAQKWYAPVAVAQLKRQTNFKPVYYPSSSTLRLQAEMIFKADKNLLAQGTPWWKQMYDFINGNDMQRYKLNTIQTDKVVSTSSAFANLDEIQAYDCAGYIAPIQRYLGSTNTPVQDHYYLLYWGAAAGDALWNGVAGPVTSDAAYNAWYTRTGSSMNYFPTLAMNNVVKLTTLTNSPKHVVLTCDVRDKYDANDKQAGVSTTTGKYNGLLTNITLADSWPIYVEFASIEPGFYYMQNANTINTNLLKADEYRYEDLAATAATYAYWNALTEKHEVGFANGLYGPNEGENGAGRTAAAGNVVYSADLKEIPSAQWYITGNGGNYEMYNRESGRKWGTSYWWAVKGQPGVYVNYNAFTNGTGFEGALDAATHRDTVRLIKVEDAVLKDVYAGYLNLSQAEAKQDTSLYNFKFNFGAFDALFLDTPEGSDILQVMKEAKGQYKLERVLDESAQMVDKYNKSKHSTDALVYGINPYENDAYQLKRAMYYIYKDEVSSVSTEGSGIRTRSYITLDGGRYRINTIKVTVNNTTGYTTYAAEDNNGKADPRKKFYVKQMSTETPNQYVLVDPETVGRENNNNGDLAQGVRVFVNQLSLEAQPAGLISDAASNVADNSIFSLEKVQALNYRDVRTEGALRDTLTFFKESNEAILLYEDCHVKGSSVGLLGRINDYQLNKNYSLFVDTADTRDIAKPIFLLAIRPETFGENGSNIDDHNKEWYVEGDYLVNMIDSAATIAPKAYNPYKYTNIDKNVERNYYRLGFVPARHEGDQLIIKSNNKKIDLKKGMTYASFAFRYADTDRSKFYIETRYDADKMGWVKILNEVPVITDDIQEAEVYQVRKATTAPTANEEVAAAEVSVVAANGAIIVKGAAGKVITVANVLGQTIANQVAASDNVTIAAPAGIAVVTVDGEATKVVVK